ncbi:MAG TPA: hypothetical protein VLD65_11675, partial [Anaerolineales bacterium]|nr:hypothetical protein [Anaerolineales bacterium]
VKNDPNSDFTEVQKGGLQAIEAGRWYELGVIVQNEMFWVFWDDQCITTQGNVYLFGTLNAFGLDPATAGKAKLDLDNWRLWDLGIPEQMRNDWISISPPTVEADRFSEGEGWQFTPAGNEKFEAGKTVLSSNGGDTTLSRDDFLGSNIAMEVTFNPQDMPAPASLIWFLGKDDTTGDHLAFEYQPGDGNWSIITGENQAWSKLIKGVTQSTPIDGTARIMVVVNGNQVSAFYDDTFLGSVDVGHPAPGSTNSLAIRNNVATHAQVDIVKLRFWNLDTVEWTTSDWITARKETAILENFTGSEGLRFVPPENEKYEDTRAVLFTSGDGTTLYRDDLQARNCAFEVSFDPRDMPDPASLNWYLGMDSSTGEGLAFEYAPGSGVWSISKYENQAWSMLTSGITLPTSKDTIATIMVVSYGDKVSAFFGGSLLGSVESNHPGAGIGNRLTLLSNGAPSAHVDVTRIRFWDLGSPVWMRNDWITARAPNFIEDNFSEGEGWQFNPVGNENYKEGRAVLFTDGSETRLTRDEMQATNLAMEVSFIPRTMPEPASLVLSLRENPSAKDRFFFEFFPGTGFWQIIKVENKVQNKIASGSTTPVPENANATIMVVVNGDHVSVFSGNEYLGSVESGLIGAGTTNELVIANNSGSIAVVDIINIRFWNLDQ